MSIFYEKYWKDKKSDVLDDFSYKWPVIKKHIPTKNGLMILDFGCGTGVITNRIKKINSRSNITGVDVSNEGLRRAKLKHKDIKYIHINDLTKLPFKSSTFDFITILDVIEHIYDTETTMKELFRVLKRGGKILISTPYHGAIKNIVISMIGFEKVFDPTGPHIRFFTKNSLSKLLFNTGFKIDQIGYFGRFFPLYRGFYALAKK